MKRYISLLLFLLLFAPDVNAQRKQKQELPKGYWHREWVVVDGERIPHVHILPVYVFNRGIDRRKYWRYVDAVKKVYPIAKRGKEMMADVDNTIASLPTKKEQDQYIKEVYMQLLEEYKPVLKKMTRTQGVVLLKLVDRETEYTAYNIIHEYRGKFLAGFWQGVSRIFGQNLKAEYGQAEEDAIIEQIVIYYEAGLL